MSVLNISDGPEDPTGLQFCSGEDIRPDGTLPDALFDVVAYHDEYESSVPMCPYGYNFSLEEAKLLRDFLNEAIEAVEGDTNV